jgi:hypothetical protein
MVRWRSTTAIPGSPASRSRDEVSQFELLTATFATPHGLSGDLM